MVGGFGFLRFQGFGASLLMIAQGLWNVRLLLFLFLPFTVVASGAFSSSSSSSRRRTSTLIVIYVTYLGRDSVFDRV